MSRLRVALLILLAAAVFVCVASGLRAQSGQHGDGHAEMHPTYEHWHPPSNPATSCCSDADCRPTRAFLTDQGWRAWNGREWLIVPPERVLPTDLAGDGRSHICEKDGFLYCFSPTSPKG